METSAYDEIRASDTPTEAIDCPLQAAERKSLYRALGDLFDEHRETILALPEGQDILIDGNWLIKGGIRPQ